MANNDLSQDEKELLGKIVRNYLSDLRMEIANTDQLSFKDNLRKEEDMLNSMIDKLELIA